MALTFPPVEDIDPDGDTLITICYPAAPSSAGEDTSPEETSEDESGSPTMTMNLLTNGDEEMQNEEECAEEDSEGELCLKVSMKHLKVASRRARAMFSGGYREAQPSDIDGMFHWNLEPIFDREAFKLVMKIIHLKTQELPDNVSLKMMANIAAVVDDLQCHDAVWFFTKIWISRLGESLPTVVNEDLLRWILIGSVFRNAELFKSSTRVAIFRSKGVLQTDLPIYPDILEAIEQKRQDFLESLIDQLHDLLERLFLGEGCDDPACRAMMMGGLMQRMKQEKLFPRPSEPFHGHELSTTIATVRGFQSATAYLPWRHGVEGQSEDVWKIRSNSSNQNAKKIKICDSDESEEDVEISYTPKYVGSHECNVQKLLRPGIKILEGQIEGLELSTQRTQMG